MVDSKDEKRISLRVSPALYNKVAQAASERNLTINAFIIQALESNVQEDAKKELAYLQHHLRMVEDRLHHLENASRSD